jgi:hypothetical protein
MDVEIERRRRPIGLHAMDGMHSIQRTRCGFKRIYRVILRYPQRDRVLSSL